MTLTSCRTLGDICDEVAGIIRTGPFGSQLHESDYQDEGVPVIMPKDIVNGKIDGSTIVRVSEENANRLAQHRLQEGEIVYGRRGDIGRRALVTAKERGWLCGTGCLRISLGNMVLDPTYLFYFLGQPKIVSWIANRAIGATLPNLNTSIIRDIPVAYPALSEQRKIASILSAYDDLIENNTRRIAILEEMARRLYREWFVDFRFPGHETTRMVESPLGPVPEGWDVKRLSDAVWVNPQTRVPQEGLKPFVPMTSLSTASMLIEDVAFREGNSGSKFKNGDTLVARITPCLENGKTGYVQFLSSPHDAAFGSTEYIVLRSKTLSPEYVYLLARSSAFRDVAIKSMTGATGRQRVQESCFDGFMIAHPDTLTIASFNQQMAPVFRAIQVLADKNSNLRRTRDLLLPRLISGEVDVADLAVDLREALA